MSLSSQASAFKKKLASQQTVGWARATPVPSPGPSTAPTPGPGGGGSPERARAGAGGMVDKRKNEVFSQPRDTGIGHKLNSQLAMALKFLKDHNRPIRLDDFVAYSGLPLDSNPTLLSLFRAHDRVKHDTRLDLYTYRHDVEVDSKESLLRHVRNYAPRGGVKVQLLREAWQGAPGAIEELEREGEVLVTRGKDGQGMRMVFWNEVKGTGQVEQEFRHLWDSLHVPTETDLARELDAAGLHRTSTHAAPAPTLPPPAKKKRKGAGTSNRRVKITNTHLKELGVDLSKDWVPPGKEGKK